MNAAIKAQNFVDFTFYVKGILCLKSPPSKCQQNILSSSFGMFNVKYL
jgi:hypothetical protein